MPFFFRVTDKQRASLDSSSPKIPHFRRRTRLAEENRRPPALRRPSTGCLASTVRPATVATAPSLPGRGKRRGLSKRNSIGHRMGSEALHAAKLYRHLLKSVKKHVGNEGYKQHFTDFITEEFKKSRGLSDPSSVENKLKLARDYAFLLNSVHYQKELLFSYNVAVDRTDEMKKVLSRSASSVGLQLPEVYQP